MSSTLKPLLPISTLSFFFFFLLPLIKNCTCVLEPPFSKTIVVDKAIGRGNFSTVQDAILSIPDGNTKWVRIYIRSGTYQEKVTVPREKGFVYFEGEGRGLASIEQGNYVESTLAAVDLLPDTASFRVEADNVVVKGITFKNTQTSLTKMKRALSVYVGGDMISFHYCSFIGVQDTLGDFGGRHYYYNCYIEGAVDFIFGDANSIYEECILSVVGRQKHTGWIVAQGRASRDERSGFVFKSCNLTGSGKTWLGRAWRGFSTVVFVDTYMPDIVVPRGWDPWHYRGQEENLVFAEVGCRGPGADASGRVGWKKNLPKAEANTYTSFKFIDGEQWLPQQMKFTRNLH